MRCTRWAVSIDATCEVRLPERGEDRVCAPHPAAAAPRADRFRGRRARAAARARTRCAPGRGRPLGRQRAARAAHGGRHHRTPRPRRGDEGAEVELQQPRDLRRTCPRERTPASCPLVALRSTRRASAALWWRLKRSTNCEPRRRSSTPTSGTWLIFALDDEPKARRQRGGEHDAVDVARVVGHDHALPGRQALRKRTVSGIPAAVRKARARCAGRRAPLLQAAAAAPAAGARSGPGRERPRCIHSVYSSRRGASRAARDMVRRFTKVRGS